MSAARETAPRHLDALTGIRGIAAWFVVFYHMRETLAALFPPWVIATFAKGYLAVDLFFMLSGFVLWYNYADRLSQFGLTEAGKFMWRRIARIWPLHAFILSLMVALSLVLAVTGHQSTNYPWAELPLHFLLIQNWGMTEALTWNDPAWSISTELAAYLLFPFVVAAARWEKLSGTALALIAASQLAVLHLLFALNGETGLGAEISRLGLWRCLLEFSLGNVLCIVWSRYGERRHFAAEAALACAASLVGGMALSLPETAFVPFAFASGLLALAADRGAAARMLGKGALQYLGEISYSTYLGHFLLFILFKLAFVDDSLQLGWLGLAGFLTLMLAASAALYHGVEKPAQRWLNRHPPRLPLRSRAVPAE